MRINFINTIKTLTAFCGLVISVTSCGYNEVVDAPYPAQSIYLPAAVNGQYVIDNVAAPDMPYRFTVDLEGRKFNVPLSAYRSGPNNSGGFKIDIAVDNDTINNLISSGGLAAGSLLLPQDKYEVVSSVEMNDGQEVVPFVLSIDMDYLLNNPGHRFALCVQVSSTKVPASATLGKAIVVIDPAVLHPAASFNADADGDNPHIFQFTNNSKYALSYAWDFGDGASATDVSPFHTYTAAGTYTVKLTATGITGETTKSVVTQTVTVP